MAHEALLTEWPRLREWIDEAREDVLRHTALVAAMSEWQEAGESPDYLFAGQRLVDYDRWSEQTKLDLSDLEQGFLLKAVAIRDDADREDAERQAREAAVDRRAKRRAVGAGRTDSCSGGCRSVVTPCDRGQRPQDRVDRYTRITGVERRAQCPVSERLGAGDP